MAYELIKVSELPELTTPSDPNVIPIQDGDYLKRISFENLKEAATGDVAGDLTAEATTRGNADTAILADLASPYSSSATYAVGDYCTKDGQLQRCIVPIETAEAWTSAHWSAVALGNDTRDLRSALSDMIIISETEPTSEDNKIWINDDADSVQVPTYEELLSILPRVTITDQAIASFDDGAENVPVISLTADSGSKISVNGKNLLRTPIYITNATLPQFANCFPIKAGTYTVSFNIQNATSWRIAVRCYDSEGNIASDSSYKPSFMGNSGNFSWNASNNFWLTGGATSLNVFQLGFPKDCYIALLLLLGDVTSSTTTSNEQMEVGGTQTAYEAYKGSLVPYSESLVINTFYGLNTIFADDGNIFLTYRADIQKYVDGRLNG